MIGNNGFLVVIGLALLGISATFFVGFDRATQYEWQRETVERGYATYCPDDGNWAWLGECKE